MQYNKIVPLGSWEPKNYAIIDAIDPDCKYHIGHPVITCDARNITMIFSHGGLSLDKVDFSKITTERFLRGLQNIFFGIYDMNSRGFYHLDVKMSNITMDKDYNFKLIDFGLSGRKAPRNFFTADYAVWAFESHFLSNEDFGDVNTLYQTYINDAYVHSYLGGRNTSGILRNYNALKLMSQHNRISLIYDKLDVYSMGIVLFMCIGQLRLSDGLRAQLNVLCEHMLDFDTTQRYNAKRAYDEYSKLICDMIQQ